jgi:hypothetical protein
MSGFQSHSMSHSQFLKIASNVIGKCVIHAERTDAKAIFSSIAAGNTESLVTVRMEDDRELRFELKLDHSEFRGKLNYSAFKANVSILLAIVGEHLQADKDVSVRTDGLSGNFVFALPALSEEQGELNALLLGANLAQPGVACLNLAFFDSSQFLTEKNTERQVKGD